MKHGVRLGLVLLALSTGAVIASAAPALANTIIVHPGESIQDAINSAHRGDTIIVQPGTYAENLWVTHNDLTIQGSGASAGGTVLVPPATPAQTPCLSGGGSARPWTRSLVHGGGQQEVDGFCVVGKFDPQTGEPGAPLVGTSISGFAIKGFPGIGIISFNAKDSTFEHNLAVNNSDYGITSFLSFNSTFAYNRVSGSDEAGIYYGDTVGAGGTIDGNTSSDNLFGIFLRDSSVGIVEDNDTTGNCVGIMVMDTPGPGRAAEWHIMNNQVWANDKACNGLSGIGILDLGGRNISIVSNTVWDNQPSGASQASGGIIVMTAHEFTGGSNPIGNRVARNLVYGNLDYDLVYDGTGSNNVFPNNQCNTSNPDGLCS